MTESISLLEPQPTAKTLFFIVTQQGNWSHITTAGRALYASNTQSWWREVGYGTAACTALRPTSPVRSTSAPRYSIGSIASSANAACDGGASVPSSSHTSNSRASASSSIAAAYEPCAREV